MLNYSEMSYFVDIEIFENYGDGYWAQEKYLVHGIDDVLWTGNTEEALNFLRYDLEREENEKS